MIIRSVGILSILSGWADGDALSMLIRSVGILSILPGWAGGHVLAVLIRSVDILSIQSGWADGDGWHCRHLPVPHPSAVWLWTPLHKTLAYKQTNILTPNTRAVNVVG